MTNRQTTILVIDDERAIREMVVMALEKEGFQCVEASDAHKAENLITESSADLLLLDWMMPGLNGVDFARKLRRNEETRNLPIIMLTAKTEEEDLIRGLESGADDYVTKPFSPKALIARIHALLRRSGEDNGSHEKIEMDGLTLDSVAHRVHYDGHDIEMGPTEFRLLQFFMQNPDRVYSRSQVLDHVWGDHVYVEERTVDVHIRRLRKVLAPSGHDKLIQTVRGAGYRLSRKS
ncbi:MAG: phosphate regulon transcriptional regulator PhoB [Gammaproteobacteria bacterium]